MFIIKVHSGQECKVDTCGKQSSQTVSVTRNVWVVWPSILKTTICLALHIHWRHWALYFCTISAGFVLHRQPSSSFISQCNFFLAQPCGKSTWCFLEIQDILFSEWSSSDVVLEAFPTQQGTFPGAAGLPPQSLFDNDLFFFFFSLTFNLIYSKLNLFPIPSPSNFLGLFPHVQPACFTF